MSVLVQISFHFQALHILSLFVFSFSWNPLFVFEISESLWAHKFDTLYVY